MKHEARIDLLKSHLHDSIDPVWAEPFHEAWIRAEGEHRHIRLAKAQAAELAAARPVIKPGELIIGNNALVPVVTAFSTAFAYGIRFDEGRLAQVREQLPEAAPMLDELEAYWPAWFVETQYAAPMSMHASLAYELFLDKGVEGMRRNVLHWKATNSDMGPDTDAWYDALLITLDGVSEFILRHAEAARAAAVDETDPERRDELERIALACEHISHSAPETFHEAVQLAYLTFWLCGHDSPGPIDRYLWPALERDLATGTITLEQAQELIDCLWLKYEEKVAYGATLGGQLEDGTDACNELTHLCLDAIQRLRILSPRTAFRWHPGISREAFVHACDVVASGASYPALVNDEAMVAAMVERGLAIEHARNYSFVGCGQTYPHGRGHGSYEDVVINSAKPLELALHNGLDPISGEQAGPATGAVEDFATYEEFEQAYRVQMDYHITERIEGVNRYRAAHRDNWVNFLRSLVSYSCVERGLDWHAGGADYSEGMVDMVGLATTTDSLFAIKQGVFEHSVLSLADLRDLLDANWEGAEELRRYFLARVPKFGNDDSAADSFAVAEVERVNEHIRSHRTVFDGPWGMDIIGWSGAAEFGKHTGATPDGRLARTPLADCAGPVQGRNLKGLTATLNSVLKLPHSRSHGPLVLSLRFPAAAVSEPAGKERLMGIVEVYFRGGGQQLQISIASTEEMKAAQVDPDAHRSLMVRVGGFSAYFVQLDKVFQDDMIARSEALI